MSKHIPTVADLDVMARIVADAEAALMLHAGYYSVEPGPNFRELKKRMHDYDMACHDYNAMVSTVPYTAMQSGHLDAKAQPKQTPTYFLNEDITPTGVQAAVDALDTA